MKIKVCIEEKYIFVNMLSIIVLKKENCNRQKSVLAIYYITIWK